MALTASKTSLQAFVFEFEQGHVLAAVEWKDFFADLGLTMVKNSDGNQN